MDTPTIAFIGAGNMARSLIGGLLKHGYAAQHIYASAPNQQHLDTLAAEYGIQVNIDNQAVAAKAAVIVLCVKPHLINTVAEQLAALPSAETKLYISVAAGVQLAHLAQVLGTTTAIVRCMPNMPAMVGNGATALFSAACSAVQKQTAESIMRAVGTTLWLNQESDMDTVTALSGSGPAYFFLFMEAMEKTAIELGLSAREAHLLTTQTALGAAHMAIQSDLSMSSLRQQVTSKNGTTERAIDSLKAAGVPEHIAKAMRAARTRAAEITEIMHQQQGK